MLAKIWRESGKDTKIWREKIGVSYRESDKDTAGKLEDSAGRQRFGGKVANAERYGGKGKDLAGEAIFIFNLSLGLARSVGGRPPHAGAAGLIFIFIQFNDDIH